MFSIFYFICRILWRHILSYIVYLCPIKREPGLYGSIKQHVNCDQLGHKGTLSVISESKHHNYSLLHYENLSMQKTDFLSFKNGKFSLENF